jgi:glutamate synthase (NADPH) small chain
VGLMLDCCGAPPQWAGREEMFEQGLADMRTQWALLGRPAIIFACPTCLALLKPRLPEAEVLFLSEIVEAEGLPEVAAGKDLPRISPPDGRAALPTRALHDPCTTRHHQEVAESVRRLLGLLRQPVEELELSRETTECCGYGGLQSNANPPLAKRVAARRAAESAREFVTYCAMCRDSLAAVGKRTVHLLDILFPGAEDPAGRARPGWSERRENRARLKNELLASVWNEGGVALEPWQAIGLHIPTEVREVLDARKILVEDLQQVIHHAEETGEKLCHGGSGRYKASYCPRVVTFWVEYSPRGSGFEVHAAYSHRMTAVTGKS